MANGIALYEARCDKCGFQDTVEASNWADAEYLGEGKHKNHDPNRSCSGKVQIKCLDENWK